MVGVPSLFLCQRGPISSIFCPILRLRSLGISLRSIITVITSVIKNAAIKYHTCLVST